MISNDKLTFKFSKMQKQFKTFQRIVIPLNNARSILLGLLLAFSCVFSQTINAQDLQVTGQVTDQSMEPLPGVSVVIQRTTVGTVTDVDGRFSLTVPSGSTLEFSFVGMQTRHIPIIDQTELAVVLSEELTALDEIVVVGYGVVRRSDLTGSVGSVRSEDLQHQTVQSFDQAIQGRVAGVHVTSTSAAPGGGVSMRIRGHGSINTSNDPLYVIDGVPLMFTGLATGESSTFSTTQRPNPFSFLDVSDIENIEILKDASATAIYGSRGSNGVVLITTKGGTMRPPEVNFETSYRLSSVDRLYQMANAEQYIGWVNEWAEFYGYEEPMYPFEGGPSLGWYADNSTDWQDEIIRVAPTMRHNISVSGGTEQLRYALSGGVLQQEGIINKSAFDRYNFRANLDLNVSPRFLISSRTSLTRSTQNDVGAERGHGAYSPTAQAMMGVPTMAPYDEEGNYNFYSDFGPVAFRPLYSPGHSHPLAIINEEDNVLQTNSIISTLYGEYEIIDNLKLRVSGSLSNLMRSREEYHTKRKYVRFYGPDAGMARVFNSDVMNLLNENTLTYDNVFNDRHRINSVIGFTVQSEVREHKSFQDGGYLSDALGVYNLGTGTAELESSLTKTSWQMASFIGRVNYVYDNRYLLTVTMRADGSSKFGAANRWAYFPSFAAAWNIHNEAFIEGAGIDFLSELKLRGSWGITGNQEIPPYLDLSRTSSPITAYPYGGQVVNQVFISSMANETLRWEKSTQIDIGLDIGLFAHRFTFSADFYRIVADDLLLSMQLPRSSGFGSVMTNIGSVENWGMDFSLSAHIFATTDFSWSLRPNISFYRNKVTDLGDRTMISESIREGFPLGIHYGHLVGGVFADEDDLSTWENGIQADFGSKPGNYKFYDINDDGVIDGNDRVYLGSPHPDFIYGITNHLSYKSFSLDLFIQGTYGNYMYNSNFNELYSSGTPIFNVASDRIEKRWTPENPHSAKYDGWTDGRTPVSATGRSSLSVEDASYLRLKTLTVSYNVPVERLPWINNFYVFVSGENLFTITNYSGLNPDVDSYAQSGGLGSYNQLGRDEYSYPLAKIYTLGFRVGF